jgi:hypothetical protein
VTKPRWIDDSTTHAFDRFGEQAIERFVNAAARGDDYRAERWAALVFGLADIAQDVAWTDEERADA